MTREDLKNKKVGVLGVGIEGLALVEYLKKLDADITVLTEKEEGKHEVEDLKMIQELKVPVVYGKSAFSNLSSFDILFRSPGVKRSQEALNKAAGDGVIISSQTQLFFDLCPCPIIGVTGTKGKGTTSSLITEMLKAHGFDAYLGGNIGVPALTFLDTLAPDSRVVLEMSSFQLQDLQSSPHIAVMLMTTSEHLDYHRDVYEYVNAKRNIFRYQTPEDFAIVNRDYPASNESDIESEGKVFKVSRIGEVDEGCFVKEDAIYIKSGGREEEIIKTKEILLPGRHNLENVCAAIMAAVCSGVTKKEIVSVLKTFKGLEHRLELIATVQGVRYYDDSFSTTPETAIAAIEAFDVPEIIILGGSSKNSDFSDLAKTIHETGNIKAIIGIGAEWSRIKEALSSLPASIQVIEDCQNMRQVVEKAAKLAEFGDVVLLSPACASFGMFKNYKDRGNQFKDAVNTLV